MATEKVLYGGYPAVLTDGAGWFSAELIDDPEEPLKVAAAVNGYADEATARRDAEKRIAQNRQGRTR